MDEMNALAIDTLYASSTPASCSGGVMLRRFVGPAAVTALALTRGASRGRMLFRVLRKMFCPMARPIVPPMEWEKIMMASAEQQLIRRNKAGKKEDKRKGRNEIA